MTPVHKQRTGIRFIAFVLVGFVALLVCFSPLIIAMLDWVRSEPFVISDVELHTPFGWTRIRTDRTTALHKTGWTIFTTAAARDAILITHLDHPNPEEFWGEFVQRYGEEVGAPATRTQEVSGEQAMASCAEWSKGTNFVSAVCYDRKSRLFFEFAGTPGKVQALHQLVRSIHRSGTGR